MEITLEGHLSFHAEGSVTVVLPNWLTPLVPEELEEARIAANRDGLILAAGRHPSGDIVFMTGAGEIMEMKTEWLKRYGVPNGKIKPIDFGQTIHIDDGSTWGNQLSNLWIIQNSANLIFLGAMASPEGTRVEYAA